MKDQNKKIDAKESTAAGQKFLKMTPGEEIHQKEGAEEGLIKVTKRVCVERKKHADLNEVHRESKQVTGRGLDAINYKRIQDSPGL